MQIQNLVQVSANIVRITELREGTVYRRLTEKSSYDKTLEIRYGVVTGIVSNGEITAVTVMEFSDEYGGSPAPRVFRESDDLAFLPCSVEEITDVLSTQIERQQHVVDTARSTYTKEVSTLATMKSIFDGTLVLESAPVTDEALAVGA